MLGGSPRYPQREHRDRYYKPEKNDSLECHDTEKVLEPPMVQNRDLPCLMVGNKLPRVWRLVSASQERTRRSGCRSAHQRSPEGVEMRTSGQPLVEREEAQRIEKGRVEEERETNRTEPQFLFLVCDLSGQHWCLTTERAAPIKHNPKKRGRPREEEITDACTELHDKNGYQHFRQGRRPAVL